MRLKDLLVLIVIFPKMFNGRVDVKSEELRI